MKRSKVMVCFAKMGLFGVFLASALFLYVFIHSFFFIDHYSWTSHGTCKDIFCDHGKVCVQLVSRPSYSPKYSEPFRHYTSTKAVEDKYLPWQRNWWFSWRTGPMDDPADQVSARVAAIPHWMVLFTFCILPGGFAVWGNSRMVRKGHYCRR